MEKNELIGSPVVSVIMNCLNGEKYLKEALDSVYRQTYDDWEIIFWDNASTDSSAEIVRSYEKKLRYFRGAETIPLYAARNLACERARGEYLAILDCDDVWLPTKLEEQVPLFAKDAEVGLVCSDAILFDNNGKQKRLFNFKKPHRGNVFNTLITNNFINNQSIVIRREVFDSLDYWFDDRFSMSGDTDFYLRTAYKWKVDYVETPLVRYRVHANSMTQQEGRKLLASEIDMMIKNLEGAIDNFNGKYLAGYEYLSKRRDIQRSLIDWEKGDPREARRRLERYARKNIVCCALYMLTFLPYKYFFTPCYRLYAPNVVSLRVKTKNKQT